MRSAVYPRWSDWDRRSIGRRATALLVAVVVHVLLLLMLLTLAPQQLRHDLPAAVKTFQLIQVAGTARRQKPAGSAMRVRHAASGGAPRAPTTRVPRAKPPPPAPTALNIVHLSREDLAAGDIGALPSRVPTPPPEMATNDSRKANIPGPPGEGPHGETLHLAEWYTRPTDAEMATYLPKNGMQPGWAAIACRTAANLRVEDCVELGQSPPGSGMARAMRQAAWQFRILPPRIGTRRIVGEWIKIIYDCPAEPSQVAGTGECRIR